MVEQAISWLDQHPQASQGLDLCTGSGCVALAVCINQARINFVAVDSDWAAMRVASQNRSYHGVNERIALVVADLATAITGKFDLITANPPYIPTARLAELSVAHHEPLIALDGGESGMDVIQRILMDADRLLARPGLLLCEIDDSQKNAALALASRLYPRAHREIIEDWAEKPRLLRIEVEE